MEGRDLSSRRTQDVVRDLEIGQPINSKSVQKLQTALHAKAKAEAGYRFYALYDKIGRDDILAHAYAQCRSNKGAPGIDGQEFADIEAYGVQRWLGELALALKQETYRPDPVERKMPLPERQPSEQFSHRRRVRLSRAAVGAGDRATQHQSFRGVDPPYAGNRSRVTAGLE